MNLHLSNFEIVKDKSKYIKDDVIDEHSFGIKDKSHYLSIIVLLIIIAACLSSSLIANHDPKYMDLANSNVAPNKIFYFGTDSMGRDVFSNIWYGGRVSLFIGIFSTVISTFIGVLYGCISGMSSMRIDNLMMKATELLLSIPSILLIIFMQSIIGGSTSISMSIVIGVVSWTGIAKVVRSEVRQIRNSEYILSAKIMGGNFFYILIRHLVPNFMSSIMFMVVSNIAAAISTESTLSFLGIGLPLDVISWGSMLSLAQNALLSNLWWVILFPGLFLIITLICIANLGNYLRKKNIKKYNNL